MLDKFFNLKTVQCLIAIADNSGEYMTQISKRVDITYSYSVRVVKIFEQLGLVKTDKTKRIRRVFITDDGASIARSLKTVTGKIKRLEENAQIKPRNKIR